MLTRPTTTCSIDMQSVVPVAIVQAAPVPLAIGDGIAKAASLAADAISDGAKLVAFGETFLGGYPVWLDEAPSAALWNHPGTKALHQIMLDQAIVENDERLLPLQELCDANDACISIGAHERVRQSLFNNQLLFRPGQPPLPHRKLVPTHGERLIWMRGDGSTLDVHQAEWGKVGNLICWEHWMPLARAAMHNLGEAVHVAAWPTVREEYALNSRHYAFEGRCFVLAAGLVQHKDDLFDGVERCGGNVAARELIATIEADVLNKGGSFIAAPDSRVVAQAGAGEETLHANLDLGEIGQNLTSLDTDGHYSRPDIFELKVNRRAMNGVEWED